MGELAPFPLVKVFVGVLTAHPDLLHTIQPVLEDQWGPLEAVSESIPFSHSTYYEAEMGSPLFKSLISFKTVISPEKAYALKVFSQQIEAHYRQDSRRPINLDPGYITPYQVVLLSTKNYAHRIALQQGIYAELELIYTKGTYQTLPWTYPDFKLKAFQDFLQKIRYTTPL